MLVASFEFGAGFTAKITRTGGRRKELGCVVDGMGTGPITKVMYGART
ncbi:hypothetical protein [Acidicapsa dinghuensis]